MKSLNIDFCVVRFVWFSIYFWKHEKLESWKVEDGHREMMKIPVKHSSKSWIWISYLSKWFLDMISLWFSHEIVCLISMLLSFSWCLSRSRLPWMFLHCFQLCSMLYGSHGVTPPRPHEDIPNPFPRIWALEVPKFDTSEWSHLHCSRMALNSSIFSLVSKMHHFDLERNGPASFSEEAFKTQQNSV